MNRLAKTTACIAGVLSLGLLTTNISANTVTTPSITPLTSGQNVNTPTQLAYYHHGNRCYVVKRCVRWHQGSFRNRCWTCKRVTFMHHGKRVTRYVKTCNFNTIRHLRFKGFFCYRGHHGQHARCTGWVWKRVCRW